MRYLKACLNRVTRLAAWLLATSVAAFAQNWRVQTVPTRVLADGKPVSVAFAVPSNAPSLVVMPPVRHVLVYPQPLGNPQIKVASGDIALTLGGTWIRALQHLQQQGVTLAYLDPPSDADRKLITSRPAREVRIDLQTVSMQLRQQFPDAQLHLAGFGAVAPLLDLAGDLDGFGKVVLASSALGHSRTSDWSSLRKPVLILHAPSAQCDSAPFIEAQLQAKRSRFKLVQVGYEKQEVKEDCGPKSQHVLQGHEVAIAKTVADWLDGKDTPSVIGYPNPPIAWREEIIRYQAPNTFGANSLEATLFLPEARNDEPGPYPVMVWNHGDIELDQPAMRYKSRIRDMLVAREFLQLGVAVLMPARRGVGFSEGTYPKGFATNDGDATYKARVHAQDILPALAWLKTRSELDANRVILAGQSAGGYSAMYIASQPTVGLIGVIDYSGGRTDMTGVSGPSNLNQMMVDGFAEFGRTTRVPTMWIFAENDSRYTTKTMRASHAAFQAAGGNARLLLNPPLEGDGHNIHHKPALWRAAVKVYLQEIGVVSHDK